MIEIIEHKGIGHPDTICDRLAEELSKLLKKQYIKEYGQIKHYNVDKVLASCGKVSNKMIKPVKIVFSGNATKIKNMKQLLKQTCKKVLKKEINRGLKYKIYNHISECSPDLTDNFRLRKSNDTSFAVGSPITKNEKLVLNIAKFIRNIKSEKIGTDFKVMLINKEIIIALAFRCKSSSDYFNTKINLIKKINKKFDRLVTINNADTKDSYFNTLTGTSLEQGDAGMTGRGNRYNNLITPMKPMTMEAYCGKNDVTHIGRIYQKKAFNLAQKRNKKILMINTIGSNIKKPIIVEW